MEQMAAMEDKLKFTSTKTILIYSLLQIGTFEAGPEEDQDLTESQEGVA